MALSNQSILNHIENWRATLAKRDVEPATILASIENAIINSEETA